MWNSQPQQPQIGEIKKNAAVAVAIDKDKGSQYALKWAVDHLLNRGQTVTLLHVNLRQSTNTPLFSPSVPLTDVNEDVARSVRIYTESQSREIFLPFRCFCSRKDVKCNEIILEDVDVSKALVEYCLQNTIEVMVVSASQKNGLVRRFKGPDVATNLTKNCPEYCTVYVISKGKMLSVRSATRPPPKPSSRGGSTHSQSSSTGSGSRSGSPSYRTSNAGFPRDPRDRSPLNPNRLSDEMDSIRSPFTRGRAANGRAYGELGLPDSDISFVGGAPWPNDRMSLDRPSYERPSYERPSYERPSYERTSYERPSFERGSFEIMDFARLSNGSDAERISVRSSLSDRRSVDQTAYNELSNLNGYSASSLNAEDLESEMRRLRLELKQTMDMYNAACKEALSAKQKASELQRFKMEEDHRLQEARLSEEEARSVAEQEKAKCKAAMEAAEAAQRLAELESQKRINAEKKALREAEERKKAIEALNHNDARYRKYTIQEIEAATNCFSESLKIGEGGYGPVYRCTLDHTTVAIKVLRPDAAQGESQFQQEVEILSCIRHPNMVLLLGACPEYGCLVYEYMYNGSLEDCLFNRGNSAPLSWQIRFIAAEIATGLLFLHQTKPEPLVHRDLKPANILLDRNFVSKISDVGLARLVPPSVADSVTQYRMTSAAGTFCYIDPEYQQTGMLGTKSDIYSLGILYLQLLTAKPAMGLTHHVQRAIDKGTLHELLDPAVQDWPYEEALHFAKLALQCAELRRKDRPDLSELLSELDRLRDFAEANMPNYMYSPMYSPPPPSSYRPSQVSNFSQDAMSNPSRHSTASGFSGRSRTSVSSSSGASS